MHLLMTEGVTLALINGVTSIILLVLGIVIKKKIDGMHTQFNSRMDQLLEAKQAQGNTEGRAELQKEQGLSK